MEITYCNVQSCLYAKNYVKNFGICELNEQNRYSLSNGATNKEVDKFLIEKYEITI